jgi:hypothetical protein
MKKYKDVQTMKLDELLEEFEYLATDQQYSIGRASQRRAERLIDVSQEIARRPDGREAVRPLMEHEVPNVRGSAAWIVLPLDPDAALPVLRELEAGRHGGASMNAYIAIQRWEAGEIARVGSPSDGSDPTE